MNGGKLGATNCVAWMFDRKGLFIVSADSADEERLMETVLEAGAEDVKQVGDNYEVICDPEAYVAVGESLEQAEIPVESKELTRIPSNTVDLQLEDARKVLKLLEALDDHDDVQNVSANFNINDEDMAELAKES